ncbi:MAG TPA: FHA domain-containing protein [Gemmataceae bacterium]|nr:FHA domain-containing protein [Gemmataceae bacterium]
MNVRLVMERKRKQVWTAQLRGPETTLGRAKGSTIRIPSSEVSRLHCRLRIEKGVVTVEDLESINGTFLNGVRVRDIEMVRPGDRLTVGPATFVVEYELTPEVLERLAGQDDFDVLEADDDEIDLVEETADRPIAPPTKKAQPVKEPIDEVEEIVEEADAFILDEDEEMNLPEGGDLRDFLIDLDDTDDRSRKHKE